MTKPNLKPVWRTIFWMLFSLNWFILPFLRYYHYSGHLVPVLRLKESATVLSAWYGAYAVVGIGFFVYLFLEKSLGVGDIEKLIISLSNCVGLLLMFVFLAPGLVDIPRNLWRTKALANMQAELEGEVGYLSSLQDEVFYELENQIKCIYKIGQTEEGQDFKPFIDMIISSVPSNIIETFATGLDSYLPKEMYENDLKVGSHLSKLMNENYFAQKNLVIRALLQKYSRSFFRIETCKSQCLLLNKFTKSSQLENAEDCDSVRPTLFQKVYYGKLRYLVYLLASLACFSVSVGIVAGEFIIFQGLSIQPLFKKCLETMNYLSYLVGKANAGCLLASILVHDRVHLQYAVRAGVGRLLRSVQAPHGRRQSALLHHKHGPLHIAAVLQLPADPRRRALLANGVRGQAEPPAGARHELLEDISDHLRGDPLVQAAQRTRQTASLVRLHSRPSGRQ